MVLHNSSSSYSLCTTPDPSWCTEGGHCEVWNVSAENLTDMCLSRSAYLESCLGPPRSPVFLPICIIYLLIFVVGAFGNGLTCAVIARYRVMRTPTNYYLFSLAVSDLLVLLLGMPLELYELWSNYPFLLGAAGCYFKTFLFETVCFASILNVTVLSVERYVAVVHPLRAKYVVTRSHAKCAISALWAASLLCAVPNTSLHGVLTLLPPLFGRSFPESTFCGLVEPRWIYNLIVQITALLFFLLPMLIISVLYLLIGLRLLRESRPLQGAGEAEANQGHQSRQQKARHRQVTKMLCVLVVVFGICWAPFHLDRVMWSYISDWTGHNKQVFEYVHLVSGVSFYLSSAVNPILYSLMSTRFRDTFKEVACRHARRQYTDTQLTLRSTV